MLYFNKFQYFCIIDSLLPSMRLFPFCRIQRSLGGLFCSHLLNPHHIMTSMMLLDQLRYFKPMHKGRVQRPSKIDLVTKKELFTDRLVVPRLYTMRRRAH
jgi:hypothetical protein